MPSGTVTVYRPAGTAGPVSVALGLVLQRSDGDGWSVDELSPMATSTGTIGDGRSGVTFGSLEIYKRSQMVPVRGYWRMLYLVSWYQAGRTIGSTVYEPAANGTQFCNGSGPNMPWCTDYGTYVWVERLIA